MPQKLSVADIAFGIATSFVVGILVAGLGWNLAITIFIALGGFIAARYGKNIFLWREICIFITTICLGALYYHIYLTWDALALTLPYGQQISISALVVDEPKESVKYEVFDIAPQRSHVITILAPPGSDYRYGDLLQLQGILNMPDAPGENPLMATPKIKILGAARGFWLREQLIDLKYSLFQKFGELLPRDEAGLLGGVAFGGSGGISPELKSEMQLSGTSYILSMYGCKIAAVVSIAGSMLKSFFSRRVIFTVNLCLITAFILMAGLEASVIRAGIMVGLALIAKQLGRTYRMKNALMLTAAIMLAFDPLLLLGDLGFQLSVLGLLGVAYLENPIKYWWQYERPGFLSWRDGVVTTLAVLIPMVPSIANNDGTFPLTAIASNVLVFFATPITVLFGFLLAAVSFVSFFGALFLAKIGEVLLWYQLAVIKLFSIIVIPLPITFRYATAALLYFSLTAIFAFYYYESE